MSSVDPGRTRKGSGLVRPVTLEGDESHDLGNTLQGNTCFSFASQVGIYLPNQELVTFTSAGA